LQKTTITFYDVEHGEDANAITNFITKQNGTVIRSRHDNDAETFTVEIEVPNVTDFISAGQNDDDVMIFFDQF
jgi:hypothetical protein